MRDGKPFDSVISYHHNVYTCGVARFNRNLADYLDVPMVRIGEVGRLLLRNPIISVKQSEMRKDDFGPFLQDLTSVDKFALLLHDFNGEDFECELISRASRVMALNSQLAHAIRPIRSDVLSGFAVASHVRESPPKQVDLRLITFGMAHKIQSKGYQRVGELLGADEREFVLEISSALHEGTAFDDSFFTVGDEISRCFGGNVEFLGFLADNEVARRLDRADAMLAFFPSGVRENNTSVIGAMSIGLPVITNLDRWSPSWARHGESVFDVNQLDRFPTNRELRQVGERGQQSILHLTFSRLTALLSSES